MKRLSVTAKLSVLVILLALAWLCGCGGRSVVYYPPPAHIGFINYPVDLAAAADNQSAPACVYVTGEDEYFVVWQDLRDGVDYDIYASFFEPQQAGPISSEILVCTVAGDQLTPKVAYNPDDEDLLVVWEDYEAGDSDIFARLYDSVSGVPIDVEFSISSAAGADERDPQVIYNPDQNNYLVIWDDNVLGDRNIMGHIVEWDGTIIDPNPFLITPIAGSDQQSAVVAYDTINNRYLVVFMDFTLSPLESDLYGQFVTHDGSLIGSDFAINEDSDDQDFPAIAFNPNNSWFPIFLVVWEDNYLGDYDITAQEVKVDGQLFDSPFLISLSTANQNNAALTYNDYSGEYVVLWEDERGGGVDIFGQALDCAAMMLGDNTRINYHTATSIMPAICSRTLNGEYLATWASLDGADYDIKGQLLY